MCLAQGHNAVTPVRLKPAALISRVKHSTPEPLRSHGDEEVSIAKSLPELAQVFEPGDLKPKSHSRKNDGSRSSNPK